ncbi:hypothetical protein EMCG_06339 [[Emmonsia] crescens]|uniref:Uncharacterized protein n=1 Tax=[Emmonsia] crescens TaxID=73230 RepID=A0A0G2IBV2_9EURO|nr:hypothetical protein EMCG_06339 [Emmonsia crescens UAMH 3008]
MRGLLNLPLQAAATLILLCFANQIHAQRDNGRRLTDSDVGWKITTVSGSTSAMRVVCDFEDSFTHSGSYYSCCPASAKTPCMPPTSCSDNTLLYPGDKRQDCKDNKCASVLIYESAPSENLFGTQLVCRHGPLGDDSVWSVYRNFPETTTSATQSTKTGAAPASTTILPLETNFDVKGSPPQTSPSSSPNKIWIAGVVVGGITCALLIGLLGFCIARRRFQRKPASSKDEDTIPVNIPSADDKEDAYSAYHGVELHNYNRAELHFDPGPVELSQFGSNVAEMPTQHHRRFVAELDGEAVRR